MASETAWLENLARRIETAARLPNNKAKLFAIAHDVRCYKDNKYSGGNYNELNPDTVAEAEEPAELFS